MRDYSRLSATFWVRGTGKELRGDAIAQTVALYLISAPTSNMIGLFYVPASGIAHDIGHPLGGPYQAPSQGPCEGVRPALAKLVDLGFCQLGTDPDWIWVKSMARRQLDLDLGESLKPGDKRVVHVVGLLKQVDDSSILQSFWDYYHETLCLPKPWWDTSPLVRPIGSPLVRPIGSPLVRPIGSQAQAQDQDQAQAQEGDARGKQTGSASEPVTKSEPKPEPTPKPTTRKPNLVDAPDDFAPNQSNYKVGDAQGYDKTTVRLLCDGMLDSHRANGKRFANWHLALNTWIRNAQRFGFVPPPPPAREYTEPHYPTADEYPPEERATFCGPTAEQRASLKAAAAACDAKIQDKRPQQTEMLPL